VNCDGPPGQSEVKEKKRAYAVIVLGLSMGLRQELIVLSRSVPDRSLDRGYCSSNVKKVDLMSSGASAELRGRIPRIYGA
jgi:hypothetical protein